MSQLQAPPPLGTTTTKTTTTQLTTLAPEILYKICSILLQPPIPIPTPRRRDRKRNRNRTPSPPPRNPILDLIDLSCTNRYMRDLCAPLLFSKIVIREEHDRKGSWEDRAVRLERLNAVHSSNGNTNGNGNGILGMVKTLEFAIIERGYNPLPSNHLPLQNTYHQLAITLSSLANLQTLTLNNPVLTKSTNGLELLTRHLQAQSCTLPKVETLVLGPACEVIVGICPNVKTVHTTSNFWGRSKYGDTERLFEAISRAEHVVEVSFAGRWSLAMGRALASKPNHSLRKLGEIKPDEENTGILELIMALSPLRNLEELQIAHVADLDMGYDAPWCGNAYRGRSGHDLMKRLQEKRRVIEGKILGAIDGCLGEWRALKTVVIGGEYALFERREVDMGEVEEKGRIGSWVRGEDEESVASYESEPEYTVEATFPVLDPFTRGDFSSSGSESDSDSKYDWGEDGKEVVLSE